MIAIAINGFGRIGRRVFRLALQNPKIKIVAINDLADAKTLSHLLKYDSIHGVLNETISYNENHIIINDQQIPLYQHSNPRDIDWSKVKPDFVIESTGKFKSEEVLQQHINNGAKRVILSVPPIEDNIKTIVLGINDNSIDTNDTIISNASCTTNCLAPIAKVLTTDQSLHDQPHRDLRRARAASQSIVPTTTGAAKALTKIFPDLSDAIGGCGIRVPVANGSLTDITINVKKLTTIDEVNNLFKNVAKGKLKGILQYTEDPIVSIDIVGNPHSCIFDSQMTSVIGNMLKIVGWYDNETGYSSRILELICNLSEKT